MQAVPMFRILSGVEVERGTIPSPLLLLGGEDFYEFASANSQATRSIAEVTNPTCTFVSGDRLTNLQGSRSHTPKELSVLFAKS